MVADGSRVEEGTYRTSAEVKERAAEIYAHWGLTLSDAINVFLVKSIDAGGLPFSMTVELPPYEGLSARAYRSHLNADGVAVLPSSWADDDE